MRGQARPAAPRAFPVRLGVQVAALAFIKGWEAPPLQAGRLSDDDWLLLFGVLACMVLPPLYHTGMSFTLMTIEKCVVSNKQSSARPHQPTLPRWLQNVRVVQHGGRWHFSFGSLLAHEWDAFRDHLVSEEDGPEGEALAREQVEDARKNRDFGVHQVLCWYQEGSPKGDRNQACHYYCGDQHCLNPRHLSWGNHRDNSYHKWWHEANRKKRFCPNTKSEAQGAPHKHAPDEWQPSSKKRKGRA